MRISDKPNPARFAAHGAATAMITPMPFDLFGEVPVTWGEVHTWCEKVAGMTGWRRDWYIQHWNVIEKVRHAKVDGSFYEAITAINSPHAAAIYPQIVSRF